MDGPDRTLRCGGCGEPVRLTGSLLVPEQLRKAVHAADDSERGADGHLAAPAFDPAGGTP